VIEIVGFLAFLLNVIGNLIHDAIVARGKTVSDTPTPEEG